ncbi:DUF2062 domain-containing protein [Martelella lutilitoris]|uniref:DUF2062 domain-containing protein n=1 Tax=Martelella lutilitoris TaxID=2583532 RepID=A0A7T7HGS3_9HYPH|nr:DUF2062 domain-containing protein [Martelella lutilitoris]QQM28844.1 DUF2062 domain-containing protein [Martelella lutilitoris]
MLFKRRSQANYWQRFRAAIWPRKGFWRVPVYLYHRTVRLRATPHAIAMGIAAGVAVSWTPFIGGHFLSAFLLAFLFGGNYAAAALGTAFGNPLTFPFIWLSTWRFGSALLGRDVGGRDHIDLVDMVHRFELSDLWRPLLEPMVVGAVLPALLSGALFYGLTYFAVQSFQQRRQAMLEARGNKPQENRAAEGSKS